MGGETEERNEPLVEDEDFYLENGLMVFTAAYLRKRGFCCQSGCRHCPYGFQGER
ncbi:MAG TPA: DUF5522 domain-containing protein [Terriglobales bacterium]|nr:DUF5522 domain-containing protein [Terriglobales bacterium]